MKLTILFLLISSFVFGQDNTIKLGPISSPILTLREANQSHHYAKFIGLLIEWDCKSDTSTWDIDKMRIFAKAHLPEYEFNGIADNWHVKPLIADSIIQIRVNVKGWKQDYTFNEFKKLIYD